MAGACVKACRHSADCTAGATCTNVAPSQTRGGRCLNDPSKVCGIDAECGAGLCAGDGKCAEVAAAYGDFALPQWVAPSGRAKPPIAADRPRMACTASGNPEQCVPRGVCQQVRLKLYRTGSESTAGVSSAFDVGLSPDETLDLMPGTNQTYLGGDMDVGLGECVRAFWHQRSRAPESAPTQLQGQQWLQWETENAFFVPVGANKCEVGFLQ